MTKETIKDFTDQLQINYVVYGNFHFRDNGDDDVDVLIERKNHRALKGYLKDNAIEYHERKYYPNQLFITGTDIKIHVTDDLYLGGRRVQYLMKMGLARKIFEKRVNWNDLSIIDFNTYREYRLIKSAIVSKKGKKLDEYPLGTERLLLPKKYLFLLLLRTIIMNFLAIPFRFLNKHLWVRL